MLLGKVTVPGRRTIWISVGQGPTALAVGAGGGCMDIFTLDYPFSPVSPSLWVGWLVVLGLTALSDIKFQMNAMRFKGRFLKF